MDKKKKPEEIFNVIYPRLRESDFRDIYLPLLLDNENPEGRARWIEEVAKKPAMRVNICADNDREEILFWVPPIVAPFPTSRDNTFERIARDFDRTAKQFNDDIAQKTFTPALTKTAGEAVMPEEYIAQWQFIMDRFEINPKEDQPTGKAKTSSVSDDDFEANW